MTPVLACWCETSAWALAESLQTLVLLGWTLLQAAERLRPCFVSAVVLPSWLFLLVYRLSPHCVPVHQSHWKRHAAGGWGTARMQTQPRSEVDLAADNANQLQSAQRAERSRGVSSSLKDCLKGNIERQSWAAAARLPCLGRIGWTPRLELSSWQQEAWQAEALVESQRLSQAPQARCGQVVGLYPDATAR